MPKLNIDEIKGITDPIEFTIEGREYTINSLRADVLDEAIQCGRKVDPASEMYDADVNLEDVHCEQLSILTGEDEENFRGLDVRKTTAAVQFVLECMAASRKGRRARQSRKR